jgi:hypothetical protein
MDVIPEALKPSGQTTDEVVAPLFTKIVGPQFTIRFVAREHMEGTDHDCMSHGHDRLPSPPTGSEALIQGRQIAPLGAGRRMGHLGQPGSEDTVAFARLPRPLFAGALVVKDSRKRVVTQFEIGPHILTTGCLLLIGVIRLRPAAKFTDPDINS